MLVSMAMNPAVVATVVTSVFVTVDKTADNKVSVTVAALVVVEVTDSVVVKVSVSCGNVLVDSRVVVEETVVVDLAGVMVFDGVVVVILKAYHGIVMTAELVFTCEVDLRPCLVIQVTYDFVVTCAQALPTGSRDNRKEGTSIARKLCFVVVVGSGSYEVEIGFSYISPSARLV
jgi:hypothetical protein